ncbi:MAG: sugar ABC transporter permease [Caldilineaceae bacterium]|nr:sugar ABC transporter permease [Caldilineaceae bacterium]MBP8109002.1 sugar ABC transporter permease [Caldilineaceae bacterium]MBP8124437.1 sugar ABC transporter permease [Caldilineaceae bacterium]MBP9073931.1 sugar ABC transporter permease [Caldilineaceae bacterium]
MQANPAQPGKGKTPKPHAKGKISKLERRRIMRDWAFITPQLTLFILLTIVPFFVAIPILFTDMSQFNDPQINPVGFRNFQALFTDPSVQADYLPALRRTVIFVLLNYTTVFIFGLSLALLMYEVGFRGGFFTVVYLPLMVSGLAVGYMAVMLFSKETGTANLMLRASGLIDKPIDIYSAQGTALILPLIVGWRYAGYNMAIFLAGLLAIPKETIEAAVIDGSTYWQRLWQVYFPQMLPSFLLATTMCLIGSFAVFDELVAMGALYVNPEAKLLSVLFFTYGFQIDRLAMGMTLAVITFVPLVFLGVFLQRLQRRVQY